MRPARICLAFGGAGALAALIALAATVPATEGCQTHQCDQSSLTIGLGPDGGVVGTGYVLVNGNEATWYSGPFIPGSGQTWQPYNGNQYVTFMIPPNAGIPPNATVEWAEAEVAAQPDAQANFIPGSGQLDELSNVSPTSVTVYNNACESYFVRVSVLFLLPDGGVAEAGANDALPPDVVDVATDGAAGD